MKKRKISFIILFAVITSFSFAQTVEVINQYPFDRENEIIEIDASEFDATLDANLVITDQNNQEVPYQLIYNGNESVQSIIFPVTVKTGTKEVYTFSKGTPKPVQAKTFARFVPERKDDFAWENDLAAYRVYGPALASENPSNGVDLWLKKTEELVIDNFYKADLQDGKSYHDDHGKGLDCYKLDHTLGAGGIAPYVNGELLIGSYFDSYKVLENGPLRSTFTVTYEDVVINGELYQQQVTVSIDAGTILNKAVVRLEGKEQEIKLAPGIFLHDGKGTLQKASGLIIYGEDAITQTNQTNVGKSYVGVIVPGDSEYKIQKMHALLISDYTIGEEFTYYFGGGWSQWKFPTQKEWLNAVQDFSKQIRYPLSIAVVN